MRMELTDRSSLGAQEHDKVYRHSNHVALLGILKVDVAFDLALLGELLVLSCLQVALFDRQKIRCKTSS